MASESWFHRLWSTKDDAGRADARRVRRHKLRQAAQDATSTRLDRAQNAVILAAEARQERWERYLSGRKYRLDELAKEHPGVAKYRATLKSLLKDKSVEWTGYCDCNVDLVDLAESLDLHNLEREYDRFLILEISGDFISFLARREKIDFDVYFHDPNPLFEERTIENELERLKALLKLR